MTYTVEFLRNCEHMCASLETNLDMHISKQSGNTVAHFYFHAERSRHTSATCIMRSRDGCALFSEHRDFVLTCDAKSADGMRRLGLGWHTKRMKKASAALWRRFVCIPHMKAEGLSCLTS